MKLFYSPGACSLADHIALAWTGTVFEAHRLSAEDRNNPDYLKINPAGAVPALQDGDWVLTQNAAILNFIADSFPEARLGGDGSAKSRAEINKWLAFLNADVHPTFKPLFGATAYLGDEAVIEQTKTEARTKLRGLFQRADDQLAGRDWLTGTRSIADPYLYVVTRWAKGSNVDLSGLDNLEQFFRHFEADAVVQQILREEGLA